MEVLVIALALLAVWSFTTKRIAASASASTSSIASSTDINPNAPPIAGASSSTALTTTSIPVQTGPAIVPTPATFPVATLPIITVLPSGAVVYPQAPTPLPMATDTSGARPMSPTDDQSLIQSFTWNAPDGSSGGMATAASLQRTPGVSAAFIAQQQTMVDSAWQYRTTVVPFPVS